MAEYELTRVREAGLEQWGRRGFRPIGVAGREEREIAPNDPISWIGKNLQQSTLRLAQFAGAWATEAGHDGNLDWRPNMPRRWVP